MRDWKYAKIPIGSIEDAKENANSMDDAEFARLVSNIRVGGLSSAPAVWRREADGKYVIISGHHRVRACRQLAMTEIPCLWVGEDEISDDEKIATQISHNSLHGESNRDILRRMFKEIESVDFKQFAHIDIDEIEGVPVTQVSISPISEHYNVSFVLYKNDVEALRELLGIVTEAVSTSDLVVLADQDDTEEPFLSTLKDIQKKYDIKSANICLSKIISLARKQLAAEQDQ